MKPRTMVLNFMLFGLSALAVSQATVPVKATNVAPLADTAARYEPAEMFRSGGLSTPLTGVPQLTDLIGDTQHFFLVSGTDMLVGSDEADDLNPSRNDLNPFLDDLNPSHNDLNPFHDTGFLQESQAYFIAGEAPHAFR